MLTWFSRKTLDFLAENKRPIEHIKWTKGSAILSELWSSNTSHIETAFMSTVLASLAVTVYTFARDTIHFQHVTGSATALLSQCQFLGESYRGGMQMHTCIDVAPSSAKLWLTLQAR